MMKRLAIIATVAASILPSAILLGRPKVELAVGQKYEIQQASQVIPTIEPSSYETPSVHAVKLAEKISILVEASKRMTEDEFMRFFTEIFARLDFSTKIDMIVDMHGKIDPMTYEKMICEALKNAEQSERMEFIAKIVSKCGFQDKLSSPEWYDLNAFDAGSGCWAVAIKAKKYAEQGDVENVARMLKLYIDLMNKNVK